MTVTTEAALLKTDKADVSVNLKPADVVNLPLNQYRNYQGLMNLVPGATPVGFQNAQTDTPGRSLTTNVNGTNRNNNVTRIDGAASINVWLPHHAGYVAPAETIETVNISTNSFDASQGMTGGAAVSVATKSGTNEIRGFGVLLPQPGQLERAPELLLGGRQPGVSVNILGGTVGGPIKKNRLFFFGGWERNNEKNSRITTLTVPTAKMRHGRLQRGAGVQPELPPLRSGDRQPVDGRRPRGVPERADPGQPLQLDRAEPDPGQYPLPNVPGTNNGTQNNYERTRVPRGDARQLRLQGQLEPHVGQPDLGQVLR